MNSDDNGRGFDSDADLFEDTVSIMETYCNDATEDSQPLLKFDNIRVQSSNNSTATSSDNFRALSNDGFRVASKCSHQLSSQLESSSNTKWSTETKAEKILPSSHSSVSDINKLGRLDDGFSEQHVNSYSSRHCSNINETSEDDSFTEQPNKRQKCCESVVMILDESVSDAPMGNKCENKCLNFSAHYSGSCDISTAREDGIEESKNGVAGLNEGNNLLGSSSLNCNIHSTRNNNSENNVPSDIKQNSNTESGNAAKNGVNNFPFSRKNRNDCPSIDDVEEQTSAHGSSNTQVNNLSLLPFSSMPTSCQLTCPFCNVHQDSLYLLEVHIDSVHSELIDGGIREATTSNPSHNLFVNNGEDAFHFVCPFCDLDLGDHEMLVEHVLVTHEEVKDEQAGGQETCPLCGLTTFSEKIMKEHIQTHLDDQITYIRSESCRASATPVTTCPVCTLELEDTDLLISHVENHFSSRQSPGSMLESNKDNLAVIDASASEEICTEQFVKSPNVPSTSQDTHSPSNSRENVSYRRQYEQSLERAVSSGRISVTDYHEQRLLMAATDMRGIDNGSTKTEGLIEKLAQLYRNQARPGQMLYLCSPTDHYSASYGDRGWGCGYRNFQMMLSSLSKHQEFAQKIFAETNGAIPSIPKIQQMIEAAWRKGFDPQGCRQLRGHLVNTSKWIGATEITACLSSLGIKCRLADFSVPSAPDGTHPRLMEWVCDYFCVHQRVLVHPLYLQHQGHSRTIVGVEKERRTTRLLLFDPGIPREQMAFSEKEQLAWKHMKIFRRTISGFRSRQYQIIAVTGLLTPAEYEGSKIIKSEQVS